MSPSSVVFFIVKDVNAKLRKIATVAQEYLEKKEPLLILVPDKAALEFVDELLWKLPEEGFLPHPTKLLQIDTEARETTALFNLKATAYLDKPYAHTIFEFEDYTSTEKLQLSKQRYAAYRDAHYAISL
jgi:DNA polymerase-3 subunit chi